MLNKKFFVILYHLSYAFNGLLFYSAAVVFKLKQLLGNDTTQQFDDLKVNLSDVNILSSDTRTSLIDLSNSGVDQIEFDAFLNEVMIILFSH